MQSRREFIQATAAAGAAYSLIPGKALGANERINLAMIGVAGRAGGVSGALEKFGDMINVVALCDVDFETERKGLKDTLKRFPKARRYQDFRKLFDEMADQIDAVTVVVPDHSHFPISMLAMSLGIHVYCEKPLAHTFQEIDLMMAARKKYNVVTQMGNQGFSGNNYHQFKAWTKNGVIKDVTRVVAYKNAKSGRPNKDVVTGYPTAEEMPESMDWDTWVGTAPHHPYSAKLAIGKWRNWFDYGNGVFGDWGPHILDTVHHFLDLGAPTRVEAIKLDGHNPYAFPHRSTIGFEFPARGDKPAVEITWYDGGGNPPPRPTELEEGRELGEAGKIIYSKELVFKGGHHGDTLRVIPEAKMRDLPSDLLKFEPVPGHHMENFLRACKGEAAELSSFDIAGPLTQVFCLGVIAERLNCAFAFDRATRQITNNNLANELLVGPPPRKGWEQFYKMV